MSQEVQSGTATSWEWVVNPIGGFVLVPILVGLMMAVVHLNWPHVFRRVMVRRYFNAIGIATTATIYDLLLISPPFGEGLRFSEYLVEDLFGAYVIMLLLAIVPWMTLGIASGAVVHRIWENRS